MGQFALTSLGAMIVKYRTQSLPDHTAFAIVDIIVSFVLNFFIQDDDIAVDHVAT